MKGVCSLEEYDTHYSLKDLCDANEALDIIDESEQWAQDKQEQKMKAMRS